MKKILVTILLGALAMAATAQDKQPSRMRFSGYSGGMMVYSGYVWGSVLAECIWTSGRWSWFVGETVGGGGVKNLTMLEDIPLCTKIDWMLNMTNPQPDFASGPRIYLGFMFSHSK